MRTISSWNKAFSFILVAFLFSLIFLSCKDEGTPPVELPEGYQKDISWPSLAKTWPMHHGNPQFTGRSKYPGPKLGQVEWEIEFPTQYLSNDSFLSFIVGDDSTIYFVSYGDIDSPYSFLYAYKNDGTLKWRFGLGYAKNTAPPVLTSDGTIYVADWNKTLFSLDTKGNLKWKKELSANITNVFNGVIYCLALDANFYIFSSSGDIILQKKLDVHGTTNSSIALSPDGQSVYIVGKQILAMTTDGEIKWTFTDRKEEGNTPLIDNEGNLYIINSCVTDTTYDGLICFKPNGEIKYIYSDFSSIPGDPTIDRYGNIYFVTADEDLISLDYNGNLRWGKRLSAYETSLVCDSDNVIYFVGQDNILRAVKNDGSIKWELPVNGHCYESPALSANGKLYFGTYKGSKKLFYCIK